jgi:hypothetical protein
VNVDVEATVIVVGVVTVFLVAVAPPSDDARGSPAINLGAERKAGAWLSRPAYRSPHSHCLARLPKNATPRRCGTRTSTSRLNVKVHVHVEVDEEAYLPLEYDFNLAVTSFVVPWCA